MNLSPDTSIEAVPSLKYLLLYYLPLEVTGREVALGIEPLIAVCKAPFAPVIGRFVPGRINPEIGLPEFVTGLIA